MVGGVDISDTNTDNSNNKSGEGSPVECIKSRESRPVVRAVELILWDIESHSKVIPWYVQ